jgi:pyruvate/2-oxoglutarate/acetoin dehydrogenase E1 component
MTQMTFAEAINDAMHVALAADPKLIAFGLGICDPKAIFGTTLGLQEAFGADRVFDIPVSENALTGLAVGAALGGYKAVMVHQRFDFALVSIDQIVNSAAKWFYMFGGTNPVPIVIRVVVGRGWGQGPTHSQALHGWFAHVPGLKVVLPSNPRDAKGLLLESIRDPNPVIFVEHRWLHNSIGDVPSGDFAVPLETAKVIRDGSDVTLVATSLMTVEARRAAAILAQYGVSCEVIDLHTVRPIDWSTIVKSVSKTGRIIAMDIAQKTMSVAGEIVAGVCERCFAVLKSAPVRVCLPDHAVPTSAGLTNHFYPGTQEVVDAVANLFDIQPPLVPEATTPSDVPGDWFRGPF